MFCHRYLFFQVICVCTVCLDLFDQYVKHAFDQYVKHAFDQYVKHAFDQYVMSKVTVILSHLCLNSMLCFA